MTPAVYELDLSPSDEGPSIDERPLTDLTVRIDPESCVPANARQRARVGRLVLSTISRDASDTYSHPDGWGIERDAIVEPLIAAREKYVAIDGRIRSDRPWTGTVIDSEVGEKQSTSKDKIVVENWENERKLGSILPGIGLDAALALETRSSSAPIMIAVIDRDFTRVEELERDRCAELTTIGLAPPAARARTTEPGHGTLMVASLLVSTKARIRPYQYGPSPGASYDYVGATHLAIAIAKACSDGADVILIADNWTILGSPRHLRRVMREAMRSGRDGRGTLMVWSSGDPVQTAPSCTSAALAADEAAAQPWGLTVGPCDEDGTWARRSADHTPLGRLGPSIDVSAPAVQLGVEHGTVSGLVDDSSIASALVAATAAIVLSHNPLLSASEVRELICATAQRPPNVDTGVGIAAAGGNDWDATGHNFKLGYGKVDALRATLSAIDPVCAAFVLAGRPALLSDPGLVLAIRWHRMLTAMSSPLVMQYQVQWAGLFARAVLERRDLRRVLLWCARHLVELSSAPSECWPPRAHQALVQRALVALWTSIDDVADGVTSKERVADAVSFAKSIEHEILRVDGGGISSFVAQVVTGAFP